jgi:hypothetical protein
MPKASEFNIATLYLHPRTIDLILPHLETILLNCKKRLLHQFWELIERYYNAIYVAVTILSDPLEVPSLTQLEHLVDISVRIVGNVLNMVLYFFELPLTS